MTRERGSPTHICNERRRTREGPEPAFVCKHRSCPGWHMQRRKGELTSCRGTVWHHVAKTSSESQRRTNQAARKGKWSPRGTVNRQAPPILEVRPGNRQGLVKTVNIQVGWAAAHPQQNRRLPGVVTHSRLQWAISVRSRVGIVLEDGSGVAIDWVTRRLYSSARRRLAVRDRGH